MDCIWISAPMLVLNQRNPNQALRATLHMLVMGRKRRDSDLILSTWWAWNSTSEKIYTLTVLVISMGFRQINRLLGLPGKKIGS